MVILIIIAIISLTSLYISYKSGKRLDKWHKVIMKQWQSREAAAYRCAVARYNKRFGTSIDYEVLSDIKNKAIDEVETERLLNETVK